MMETDASTISATESTTISDDDTTLNEGKLLSRSLEGHVSWSTGGPRAQVPAPRHFRRYRYSE